MRMYLTVPMPEGHYITQPSAEKLKGQWVTLLAFGKSILGQVERGEAIDDGHNIKLVVKVDQNAGLK
jgi:hypothetical protein